MICFLEEQMATNNQSFFHPRLIIVDHFDEAINQIDIKTETILLDQALSLEMRNEFNDLREKQIEKIDEIKELNLSHLPQKFNEEEFRQKWSHVVDDDSLEYRHKIDRIKEEIILYDCVLLDNPKSVNGCILWITSWFHNERDLDFLR
jgi:hypothetical protein